MRVKKVGDNVCNVYYHFFSAAHAALEKRLLKQSDAFNVHPSSFSVDLARSQAMLHAEIAEIILQQQNQDLLVIFHPFSLKLQDLQDLLQPDVILEVDVEGPEPVVKFLG